MVCSRGDWYISHFGLFFLLLNYKIHDNAMNVYKTWSENSQNFISLLSKKLNTPLVWTKIGTVINGRYNVWYTFNWKSVEYNILLLLVFDFYIYIYTFYKCNILCDTVLTSNLFTILRVPGDFPTDRLSPDVVTTRFFFPVLLSLFSLFYFPLLLNSVHVRITVC